MRMLTTARSCWLERVTMLELPVETRLCGTRALAFFRARVIAADGRGTLERSGSLTPYALEEIAENARRAGSVWFEVAARGDGPGLSAVWEECARLAARGISVNFRLVGEAALRRRGATERAA